MPVIKSAKKKLRQDKKRTLERAKVEATLKDAVKKAREATSVKTVSSATSLLDKAAKKHIIHKNKAARLKSHLAHLLSPKKIHSANAASGKVQAKSEPKSKVEKKVLEKKTSAKKATPKTKKSK